LGFRVFNTILKLDRLSGLCGDVCDKKNDDQEDKETKQNGEKSHIASLKRKNGDKPKLTPKFEKGKALS
jgi:hypothetical protein